jgi:hypothetical protein
MSSMVGDYSENVIIPSDKRECEELIMATEQDLADNSSVARLLQERLVQLNRLHAIFEIKETFSKKTDVL